MLLNYRSKIGEISDSSVKFASNFPFHGFEDISQETTQNLKQANQAWSKQFDFGSRITHAT